MSLLEFFDLVFGANKKKQQEDCITLKQWGKISPESGFPSMSSLPT